MLKFKKNHVLILVSLILSVFISGCSINSLGFLQELEKAQTVSLNNPVQTVNTISISNLNLPTELDDSSSTYLDFLSNNYINITQKYNPTNNVSSIFVDTTNKVNNKREHIITMKFKDNAFSVSFGAKVKALLSQDEESKAMLDAIDNKLIPLNKLAEALDEDIESTMSMVNMLSNKDSLAQLNKKSMDFLKEFIEIYKELKPDVLSKEDNAYVIYFDNEDFVLLLDSFVKLSINNYKDVIKATANFYESLTDEEFNTMYGSAYSVGLIGSKEEVIALLKEASNEELPADLITQWDEMYKNEISPVLVESLKGSSFRMRTWSKDNKFYTNAYARLKVANPYSNADAFNMDILSKQYTEIISKDFDVQMPTSIVDFNALGLN